jgi:hypothetical protein
MKKILIVVALLSCAILGCKKVKIISYAGVFKLNKQIISSGAWDTTWMKEQAKIYTDRYYMYSGLSSDTDVRFGFGTYELESNKTIAEHNIFSSKVLDSAQIFVVQMNQTANGLTAVVPEWARSESASYKLTEDYIQVPSSGTSALDGVWELDKLYRVKGKDTTSQHETQFKIFWQGHFMFIRRYPVDPVGTQYNNGFGYGNFTLKKDTLYEMVEMSNHKFLANKNITISIDRNANEYTEVFNDPETHLQTTQIYKKISTN